MRLRLTMLNSRRNTLWNPRLGRRRCSGICPPSKLGWVLPPERAPRPLCPRPEVLPTPEPGPRPSRLRALRERGAGDSVLRSIVYASTRTRCRTFSIMPRVDGLDGTTTVLPRRVRPSPRSVWRCRCVPPIGLPTKVTFIVCASAIVARSRRQLGDGLAAPRRDLLGGLQLLQRGDRRLHHVVRIVRAEAFGEHVAHAGELDDRAYAAAGDHAGAFAGRAQQHVAGAVAALHVEGNGAIGERHAHQRLFRRFD